MREFSQKYLKVLRGTFSGLNLTAITDDNEFYHKQILDSLAPWQQSAIFAKKLRKHKLLVDIGFGGGFPLLPLAHLCPNYTFIGFEARRKKSEAVKEIAQELNLTNVKVYHQRLEAIYFDRSVVVTFKAIGDIITLTKKISYGSRVDLFFYKGPNYYRDEKLRLKELYKEWDLSEEIELEVPQTEKRVLIGLTSKKAKEKKPNYLKSKSLVNLESYL